MALILSPHLQYNFIIIILGSFNLIKGIILPSDLVRKPVGADIAWYDFELKIGLLSATEYNGFADCTKRLVFETTSGSSAMGAVTGGPKEGQKK